MRQRPELAARAALALVLGASVAARAPAAQHAVQAAAQAAAQAVDALDLARLEARLDKLVLEFAAAGFELERAALEVEPADADAWRALFDRPGATLRAADDNPAAWLLDGVHVGRAESVAALRAAAVDGLVADVPLRYDAVSERLVVPRDALEDVVSEERALAHELARVWLDRRFGLARLRAGKRTAQTREEAELCAALEEGLADAVALEVLLARGGRTLADMTERQVEDTLARLGTAPGPLARFEAGRRFAVEGVRAQGRAFLERSFEDPPPSSEALIHAAKRGQDTPLTVELVDWPDDWEPVPLVVDDVVGEQGLYDALLGAGLARPAAWRAAAGWDGDRIRLWADGREALWAWRIVCDREVDASQLVSSWGRFECRVRRAGRAFVCVLGTDSEHVEAMLDRLAALPLADGDPLDAASAQAIEAAMPELSAEARVDDGRWLVPSIGLTFPAPAGWRPQKMSGTPFLFAPERQGNFIDNLNARTFEDPSGGDLPRIAAENRRGLEELPGLRLETCEVVELPALDQQAVWIRYSGAQGGNELEFRVIVIPRGGKLHVVTATLLAEHADAILPEVERALLGARAL